MKELFIMIICIFCIVAAIVLIIVSITLEDTSFLPYAMLLTAAANIIAIIMKKISYDTK